MTTVDRKTEERAAIEAANKRAMEAFGRQDAAALAAVYAEQAVLLPPNAESVHGRPAIQRLWQGAFEAGLTACRIETLDVESVGDLAVEEGRYTLYAADDQIADEGKYIQIWKRMGGRWQSQRDIWNSSRPAER
jgi:uncharacterized protein (TIGR02246 family)